MYCLTNREIEYIFNEIKSNGIEIEDLQLNLLDHICCLIEQNLRDGDDFESFCKKTLRQFYKNELLEIEEETIQLLIFKNYYVMKKVMIISGTLSVAAFITGSICKILHLQLAAPLLFLAIINFSLVFLPLLLIVKIREINASRDKLIIALGTIVGILYCLSMLSLVMHWTMKGPIWLITLAIAFFIFIPAYFFTGIRKPQTKGNTIIASILMVAVTGIQFTLTDLKGKTSDQTSATPGNEALVEKSQPKIKITIPANWKTIK
ncbi:MAG: hypothetical protein WKF91_04830 [Segetibacter sp.]